MKLGQASQEMDAAKTEIILRMFQNEAVTLLALGLAMLCFSGGMDVFCGLCMN